MHVNYADIGDETPIIQKKLRLAPSESFLGSMLVSLSSNESGEVVIRDQNNM